MEMIDQDKPQRMTFDVDAARVLGSLRTSIANVISTAGGMRKPADLQKSFKLDWTLSWQLFQIAGTRGSGDGGAISRGANVPSRTSLKKFLEAAKSHGIDAAKVDRVWEDYQKFEHLVNLHAGDRTSFNSMVSAAASMDEEWISTNAQHLRNAYRAMSHVTGMQAKAKMICGMYNNSDDRNKAWDIGVLVGYVGLRMLREVPSAQVFRIRMIEPHVREVIKREPLALNRGGNGYLLEDYSTKPLPAFKMRELDAGWLIGELERPEVGNLGASTMHFGTVYRNHPVPGVDQNDDVFTADVVVDKPVEVLINDSIVKPGIMRGAKPSAEMFLGNNHSDATVLPGDLINLLGDHRAEFLGIGPEVLASPDVPQYPEMVQATANKLGWDISKHEVWRIRTEYPAYQTTVRMKWKLPSTPPSADPSV